MADVVVWNKCNVFGKDSDEPTTLERGDMVPDGVDDIQRDRLRVIGAIRPVDEPPRAEEASEKPAEGTKEPVPVPVTTAPVPEPDALRKPGPGDSKEAWVAYASDERNPNRIPVSQAQSMSKSAIMDRFRG